MFNAFELTFDVFELAFDVFEQTLEVTTPARDFRLHPMMIQQRSIAQ